MASTKKDPWMEILEGRIAEQKQKNTMHDEAIREAVENFREWAKTATDIEIIYDGVYRAEKVKKCKEVYHIGWEALLKAEAELEAYKEAKGL